MCPEESTVRMNLTVNWQKFLVLLQMPTCYDKVPKSSTTLVTAWASLKFAETPI